MPLLTLASLLTVADLTIGEDIGLVVMEALAILAAIIFGGRYLLQPIFQRVALLGSPEIFTVFTVLLVLGTAVLMTRIGLSMAMGAFMNGTMQSPMLLSQASNAFRSESQNALISKTGFPSFNCGPPSGLNLILLPEGKNT